jgi:aminoglycoside phosphotransferase (APT) family kinase protein
VLVELERQGVAATALAPDRWLRRAEAAISRWDLDGIAPGLEWARQNAPVPSVAPSICHGDLGPGNVFLTMTTVTGVIDWTLAGLADPAYDLGFATATIELAPVPVPRPARRALGAATRRLARRFQDRYAQHRSVDNKLIDYYRALRCLDELAEVAAYRAASARGQGAHDRVGPAWDVIADDAVVYFRDLTGVTLQIPAAL